MQSGSITLKKSNSCKWWFRKGKKFSLVTELSCHYSEITVGVQSTSFTCFD